MRDIGPRPEFPDLIAPEVRLAANRIGHRNRHVLHQVEESGVQIPHGPHITAGQKPAMLSFPVLALSGSNQQRRPDCSQLV
jgi:hypothetical protein